MRIPFSDNFAAVLGPPVNRSDVAGARNRTLLQAPTVILGSVEKDSLEIDINCMAVGDDHWPVTQLAGLFGDRPLCSVLGLQPRGLAGGAPSSTTCLHNGMVPIILE